MRYREPSATAQVVEWLQAQPVGRVIWAATAHAALPYLNPKHVSAALSLLAQPRYSLLTKLPREGRYQPYRVSELVLTPWNGHTQPRRNGGEQRPRGKRVGADPATRVQAAELLLEAAAMAEAGDDVRQVLDTIRAGYYKLKGNRR